MASSILVGFFLFDVSLILLLARVMGRFAEMVGQPRVVGEIVAGVLLGPTLPVVAGNSLSVYVAAWARAYTFPGTARRSCPRQRDVEGQHAVLRRAALRRRLSDSNAIVCHKTMA